MDARFNALILDSQELFGTGLKCLLMRDRSRLRPHCAATFDEVFALLEADPQIHLAVLDIDAPGMAGAATAELLRRRFPDLRIILATGRSSRSEILGCLAWSIHGVIVKTQPAREIAGAIRVVLAGGVCVPPMLCDAEPARTNGRAIDVLPFRPGAAGDTEIQEPEAPEIEPPAGAHLSARQAAVFRLLARGLSNKAIARELGLAEGTVKVHLAALYRALRVRNRASAVASLADDTVRGAWHSAAAPLVLYGTMIG